MPYSNNTATRHNVWETKTLRHWEAKLYQSDMTCLAIWWFMDKAPKQNVCFTTAACFVQKQARA